jgi:hypothetical protein
MSFPQLRVRTEFSFRKVFGPVADVARACADLGAPLAAMVDSGTHGHVRWAAACKSVGITPAFGREVIVKTQDGRKPVCWVLAEDIKQFYHFSTALERIDCEIQIKELLRDHPGIIRFAGDALEDPALFDYVDINPSSIFAQRKARALAARTGKPLIHTSYNSYPLPEDAKVAAALGYGETAAGHLARPTDGHALGEIASRLATVLPVAPLIRVEGDFLGMVEAGRQRRLQLGHLKSWPQEYQQRLERELSVIAEKQFESYFIVVADMVMWAKERMLVGPARGSSAGSLVCYLLGITEVDPIFHGLLFERFIDLNRKDLPDIDVDFNDKKRDKVFAYLSEKYGRDNVARLGNVNTYKPRSLLAQVCKSFGIPDFERFNVINVLIEYSSGDSRYGKGLEDTFQNTEFGQNFNKKFPQAAEIAARIENHASHAGVHAAGVIVSNEPVSDYCTIGADGVAQLDKPDAEALNLLKIDALGLRTLGVIEDAGVVTTDRLYALQLNDPAVFEVFNQKKFSGIFQFEGQAQRSISAQVHVSDFMHIDHLTALARPGPLGGGAANKYINRHAGRELVEYDHDALQHLTKDTYGLVLYQEQTMNIVREIGNFNWEDTSFIRKAMSGRKGNEYFAKKKQQFIENAQRMMPESLAGTIWDQLASMGSWTMNACILGNTKVRLAWHNPLFGSEATVEELYNAYILHPSVWIKQRKMMPILLSFDGESAKPAAAVKIYKNGIKPCLRLEFSDGVSVECTADHRFVINGEWMRCGDAKIGDEFLRVARQKQIKDHGEFHTKSWRKGRKGAGKLDVAHGRVKAKNAFKELMEGKPCQDCGASGCRLEVHHNDFVGGKERPDDLAWVCSSCHKLRHKAAGNWGTPHSKGWEPDEPATLLAVVDIGEHETYDIEMPDPHHNYVLANGIVTHNSHTCSYAVISYWCAWMKVYHPLEYAAAALRNAKDDDQTIEILREITGEGVEYLPFDIDLSDVNWSVQAGKLVGGFTNLVGVGPAKANAAIAARAAGKLDRAKFAAMKCKFTELFPITRLYSDLYANPEAHGCREGSKVLRGNELPVEGGDVLYIGRLSEKELRDENEAVRLQRRNGRRLSGNTKFLDLVCRDDTGIPIICRIDRFDFERIGRKAANVLQVGVDDLLVRGRRVPGFPMIKVDRFKVLNREV